MPKTFNYLFVIILIICSINFFNLQSINGSFVRYIQFGYLLVAIIFSFPYLFPKSEGFVIPVQIISFSVFLSIFMGWLTWGQNLTDCITGTIPMLIWVIFFYLKHIKFPIEQIEKIIVSYGILYLILYLFQFTHADINYFINTEEIDLSRGIARIVFPGRGVFYLTIFIAINKFTTEKKNQWFWAFLAGIGIIVTVMQVTRQFIFGTILIYMIHFLRDQSFYKKIIVISAAIGIMFYISQSDNPIVKGLMKAQEDNMSDASNNVRIQAATFFLTDFSYSTINRVLGNGAPYGKNSKYNIYTDWYAGYYGFYLSDVGLISLYAMYGIFAVLGYVLIWIKSFTIKLPKEYLYLKYYLWFLLLTSLTSDTIYASSDLITTVIVIYTYQVIYEREKYKSLNDEFSISDNKQYIKQ